MVHLKVEERGEFEKVAEELKKAGASLGHEVLVLAARRVLKKTALKMASKVPIRTGEVSESIKVFKVPKGKRRKLGETAVGPREARGLDPWYAHFLEDGTVNRETKKGKNTGKVKAYKFVQKTFEEDSERIIQDFADQIVKVYEKKIGK